MGRFFPALLVTLCITASFTLSPALRANAQTWVNGFVRDVNGLLMVNCTNCSAGSGVQTVSAGDTSITVGGTTANPTVKLNTANTNTFQNFQAFVGTAGNCTGYPSTVYGICIGTGNGLTNNIGIALGPQGASGFGCSTACTPSSSAQLCLYSEKSTGPQANCIFGDSAGEVNVPTLKITSRMDVGANPLQNPSKIGSYASCTGTGTFTGPAFNGFDCIVTLSSGAAVWTFGSSASYSAKPVVSCTNETSATDGIKCVGSTTGVTLTGTGSDVIDVHVFGNGGT